MKIVFVMTQSLDSPSGLGRFGPLARQLARLGHEVDLLALHYAWDDLPPEQRRFVDAGVRIQYAGPMHVRKQGARKTYYSPAGLLAVTLSATLRLALALWRSPAEVIQLCKPQPVNSLAAILGGRGRPLVCDCDDYEAETNVFSAGWQRSVVRFFEDGIVRRARVLSVNTPFLKARYSALGFPAQKIVYVPNGVERTRFAGYPDALRLQALRAQLGLQTDQPVIVYVGSLGLLSHPLDLLLQAFQRVLAVLPEARLVLVGGGEDFDKLQRMALESGIAGQTIFTGRVPPADAPLYFGLGSVSVDPVRDNGVAQARSPLKILESLAVGVPVVTANVGDRAALLSGGSCGVLTLPDSASALADGLLSVLQSPERRETLARATMQARERWFWDVLAQDFLQVYRLAGVDE